MNLLAGEVIETSESLSSVYSRKSYFLMGKLDVISLVALYAKYSRFAVLVPKIALSFIQS